MTKESNGTEETIDFLAYETCYWYHNQTNLVDGIPVDPLLRPDFDSTPNDDRDPQEISDWWNKPYIRTSSWEDMNEPYEAYKERLIKLGYDSSSMDPPDQFEARKQAQKQQWFDAWPTGTRYEVRCLNGGAWDRSTALGMFKSLDDALIKAKAYEPVNYGIDTIHL
jgi:hypothetical protein